jgi:drug/metabolite transporter (DMT)-like permease
MRSIASIRRAVIVLAAAASLALAPLLTKQLSGKLHAADIALWRAVIGASLLWAFVLWRRPVMLIQRALVWQGIIGGAFMVAIPFMALAAGQGTVTSSMGGLLYGVTPLFILVLSRFLPAGERMSVQESAGVAVALLGLIMTVLPNAATDQWRYAEGKLITLVGPLSYAAGAVCLRLLPKQDGILLVAWMYLLSLLWVVPASIGLSSEASRLSHTDLLALLMLGSAGSVLPTLLVYMAVRDLGNSAIAVVMYLLPIFSMLYGSLIRNESFAVHESLGCAAILAGCVLTLWGSEFVGARAKDAR